MATSSRRSRGAARRARRFLREQHCNLLALRSFVDRRLVTQAGVHWLFILTLPNGGSTALARLLLSASAAVALTDTAEGHRLIPSLSRDGVRWDENHRVAYRKVRAVWLARVARAHRHPQTLVIEKSPPNMCRYRHLRQALAEMPTYVMTLSRDPYATCASWHHRYGVDGVIAEWQPGTPRPRSETDYFRLLARIWLTRSRLLLRARRDSFLDLSYERFADETAAVVSELARGVPLLSDVRPDSRVAVKDYPSQRIRNMNEEQIATLSLAQRQVLSSALAEDRDTVEALGYRVR